VATTKRTSVILSLSLMASCQMGGPDAAGMDDRITRLVGQNIDTAISRLGTTSDTKVVKGFLVSVWTNRAASNPSDTCQITLSTDPGTHIIEHFAWKGSGRACDTFQARLAEPAGHL
jgi:hypothetical protein